MRRRVRWPAQQVAYPAIPHAAVVAALGSALLAGCGSPATPEAQSPAEIAACPAAVAGLEGDGTAALETAMQAWAQRQAQRCAGASVAYRASNSDAGMTQFLDGNVAFAGIDRPLTDEERGRAERRCAAAPAHAVPVGVVPVAVAVNVPGVAQVRLRPATLARLLSGDVRRWNDPAVAADNPGAALPSLPVTVVRRRDASGMTRALTSYLQETAGPAWTHGAADEWPAPNGRVVADGAGVAEAVGTTEGAIGWVSLPVATKARLPLARLGVGEQFVEPSPETAGVAATAAAVSVEAGLPVLSPDYATTASGAYPLIAPLSVATCAFGVPEQQLAAMRSFLRLALTDGQQDLPAAGAAALPESLRAELETVVRTPVEP